MLPVVTTDPPPEGHRPTERSFGILGGGDFRRFFVGFFFKEVLFYQRNLFVLLAGFIVFDHVQSLC